MINASQTLLGGILENHQSGIFAVDRNYNYLWFNNLYASNILSSFNQNISTGMKMPECIELNHQYKMHEALDKVFQGDSFTLIQKPREKEENQNVFEFYFYPIIQNKNIIGAACQITDVSDRVKIDRQKFENLKSLFEKRLNGFSRIIQDFILICDSKGVYKFANKSYCDFFEVQSEDLTGQSYFDKIPEGEKKGYLKNLNNITPENPSITHIHLAKSPSGIENWTLWNETAVFDRNGNFQELLSIGRNVDGMIRAKQLREKYIDVLEQTIFKTSHEVRQPISNILGLAQIMEREDYNPKEMAFIIDYFKESAGKLDLFTKELTHFIHSSIDPKNH